MCIRDSSLASCGDNNQFLVRDAADLVNVYQYVGGDFNVSQLLCQFHHIDHTAARNRYFSFAQNRDVNDLLQSVNIGRKSSNDDSRLEMCIRDSLRLPSRRKTDSHLVHN